MKRADELIPWRVTDISFRPYKRMWSFNPSIHYDGSLWRCILRCCDYAMPDGVTIRSSRAKPGEALTKNAMVIFDPVSWEPTEIYKMHEHDGLPRVSCGSVGYEDVRIFWTDKGGLQGIAASLHLQRDDRGRSRKPPVEQVLLSFDAEYNIVGARPIRGDWSDTPQKNWVPFDRCVEPRFLYSIARGTLFDDGGATRAARVGGMVVRPSMVGFAARPGPSPQARDRAEERAEESEIDRADRSAARSAEGRRAKRPREPNEAPSGYADLRGGTQLVRVGDDAWLGIGHAMRFVDRLKYYWHVWYLVDSKGKMKSASVPMKLVPNGIEFAAGMAIDGDRVVVSFGVDDMECKIGETKLSAVMETLQKIGVAV